MSVSNISRAVIFILFLFLVSACQPADKYQDELRVISDVAKFYDRPSITSNVLQELKFGDKVMCRDKNPSFSLPNGWVEAKLGAHRGFMEKKWIAEEKMLGEIKDLMSDAKDAASQGTGQMKKRAVLRLKPEKDAFVVVRLREPTKGSIIDRVSVVTGEKEKAKRQIWYKIRLEDGRTGFITKNLVQLVPPGELNAYTAVRAPVTWYALNDKEDESTGNKGKDYLVTYSSIGANAQTDYTRFELYTFEPKSKQYATALARSGLYGILPVKITEEGDNKKMIEFREHPKGDQKKVHVIQYTYPSPIKVIKDYVEEAEVN